MLISYLWIVEEIHYLEAGIFFITPEIRKNNDSSEKSEVDVSFLQCITVVLFIEGHCYWGEVNTRKNFKNRRKIWKFLGEFKGSLISKYDVNATEKVIILTFTGTGFHVFCTRHLDRSLNRIGFDIIIRSQWFLRLSPLTFNTCII